MARRIPYKTTDGNTVPGVTTVIGRFKESGGLIHWAWTEGVEGRDYRDARDTSASAGTYAHKMIEAELRGEPMPLPPPELTDAWQAKARNCVDAYHEWREQSRIKIIWSERRLVSEQFRFGGQPDALGQLPNGKLILLDWKTANGIYPDNVIQLAAYGHLLFECEKVHVDEYHLLRFGKESADFHHHRWEDLSVAWRAFKEMRPLFETCKLVKKMV